MKNNKRTKEELSVVSLPNKSKKKEKYIFKTMNEYMKKQNELSPDSPDGLSEVINLCLYSRVFLVVFVQH